MNALQKHKLISMVPYVIGVAVTGYFGISGIVDVYKFYKAEAAYSWLLLIISLSLLWIFFSCLYTVKKMALAKTKKEVDKLFKVTPF